LFHQVYNVLLVFKPLFDRVCLSVEPLELVDVEVRLLALLHSDGSLLLQAVSFTLKLFPLLLFLFLIFVVVGAFLFFLPVLFDEGLYQLCYGWNTVFLFDIVPYHHDCVLESGTLHVVFHLAFIFFVVIVVVYEVESNPVLLFVAVGIK
jgi:hypothetical protein